jgi:acyl-CoA synthetase (AMP-forming)/AMP-acid ligase II
LDVSVQAQVVNLLKDLQDEFGLSYIFVAHDLSVVRQIADVVAVMYLGQIVEIGDESDVLLHPSHPYTQALVSALPTADEQGNVTGDRIILSLPTSVDLVALYLGALCRGVVPLVEPSPRVHRGKASARGGVDAIRRRLDARWCVVPADSVSGDLVTGARPPAPDWLVAVDDFLSIDPGTATIDTLPSPSQPAHFQATSGSTGAQKVAVVTHGNIAANIDGIGRAIRLVPHDALLFWLPLYHDMGLIAVSCALYWQRPMTITDPAHFVRNPIRFWLQLMGRYRATITAAPNSAYEACARLARLRTFDELDLSAVRAAFWGAEPVFAETIAHFERAFGPYGYRPEATLPVYGLAEATLAAAVPDVDAVPRLHEPTGADAEAARPRRTMVSVGLPLANHTVRIVDDNRQPVAAGTIGDVEVGGPSIVERYWVGPDENERVPEVDGFLRTGDLGYQHDGELYIVGRKKDIIIIRGRNFIPSDLEAFTDRVVNTGIHGGVAAFGVLTAADRTEALHLAIESRTLPRPDGEGLEARLRDALAEAFGIGGVTVHWVGKGAIPKTTSGKIQRFRCAELVRVGEAAGLATA